MPQIVLNDCGLVLDVHSAPPPNPALTSGLTALVAGLFLIGLSQVLDLEPEYPWDMSVIYCNFPVPCENFGTIGCNCWLEKTAVKIMQVAEGTGCNRDFLIPLDDSKDIPICESTYADLPALPSDSMIDGDKY